MIKLILSVAVLGLALTSAFAQEQKIAAPAAPAAPAADKPAALNYTMKDIDGKDVDLSIYKGKVVMILNVASRCGNTPQYTALQALYTKYQDKGLVIIGFPANNFGGQEPGTEEQIKKEICTAEDSKYHVTFPMMSKVSVKGADIAPLFKYLTSLDTKPLGKGDIAWNFEKFLIGRDGTVINRFANRTKPDDASIVSAIEAALAK